MKFLSQNTQKTDIENKIKITLPLFKNFIKSELKNRNANNIEEFILSQGNRDLPDFLNKIDELINYNYEFEDLFPNEINEDKHEILIESLKKIYFDFILSMSTGIVIAGFNKNDMYPSCMQFNIHFNYKNEVKISNFDYLINYDGNAIIPFAQKDVMKTFINGIDEEIKKSISLYFYQFTKEYLKELKDELNSNDNLKKESLNEINQEIDKFIKGCENQSHRFFKNIGNVEEMFTKPILDSIGGLPKNELANMG